MNVQLSFYQSVNGIELARLPAISSFWTLFVGIYTTERKSCTGIPCSAATIYRYIDISQHNIFAIQYNRRISYIDMHKNIIIGGVPAARAATTKLLQPCEAGL